MNGSQYLTWAKLRSQARFPLAASGVCNLPLTALPVQLSDLALSGPAAYGHPGLRSALAERHGVDPGQVVTAAGTSMANHLVFAALLEPGDEVLIERPGYEPLLALARHLRATVRRFERRVDDGFRVDPEAIARAVTPRTRLIVLTNLHNPSGVLTDEATLASVGEIARDAGARVLVDEVYLDAVFDGTPRSAIHLGPTFVVTSSLTKVYGLSGLRCGWILAEPRMAERVWQLTDLYDNHSAYVAAQLGVIALGELGALRERTRALLAANRPLLDRFLDERSELAVVRPAHGTIVFPRLGRGSVDALCTLARERYDTSVVPGHFFEMPEHFRIGIGCETELLRGGLQALSAALDALRQV